MVSHGLPTGSIAVIFTSRMRDDAAPGYDEASAAMVELVQDQPGFLGFHSARGPDGLGITVSYWEEESAALAWRDNADHADIREQGRRLWYDEYSVEVARIERSYVMKAGR